MSAENPEPLVIVDFTVDPAPDWRAIDDVVMGGVSRSTIDRTEDGIGIFAGEVSLANNGGFASVRTTVGPLDLTEFTHLELRVRGDGRRYRVRLRTEDGFDGVAYQAVFATTGDGWQEIRLPLALFQPTFRGRSLVGEVPPLDRSGIRQLGLMIADKQAGPFRLEIEWIRAVTGREGED